MKYLIIFILILSFSACTNVPFDDGTDVMVKKDRTGFDDGTDVQKPGTDTYATTTVAKKPNSATTSTSSSSTKKNSLDNGTKTTSTATSVAGSAATVATTPIAVASPKSNSDNDKVYKLDNKSSSLYYPVEDIVVSKDFSSKNNGLDFQIGKDADILATGPGLVIFSGKKGSLGNTVLLYHNKGLLSIYYNLKSLKVNKGDYVKSKNHVIATATDSFHFELRQHTKKGSVVLNPRDNLKMRN